VKAAGEPRALLGAPALAGEAEAGIENLSPAGRLLSIERTGVDVTLRCLLEVGGIEVLARITPAAVASLGLSAGGPVWLAVKSHSISLLGGAAPHPPVPPLASRE
jgi:ABC-type molybdate transport system ATPase subunit